MATGTAQMWLRYLDCLGRQLRRAREPMSTRMVSLIYPISRWLPGASAHHQRPVP